MGVISKFTLATTNRKTFTMNREDVKKVVGIGELLWDVFPDGKQLGGAPGNFAYHVGQRGFNSCVVSAIGKDSLGTEMTDLLEKRDICKLVSAIDYPTGVVDVQLDNAGVPSYEIVKDVAWDYIPFTKELELLAKETQVVCFGSLAQRNSTSKETIDAFIKAMPKTGNEYVVFDINLRQDFFNKELLDSSFTKCNILKINDEELEVIDKLFSLIGESDVDKCREIMSRYDIALMILTCGTNGSYVINSDEYSFLDTPRVSVADTVGAGDSFTAGFISGLLEGKTIQESHQLAVDISCYVCTQHGAMPKMNV